jgi:hypothetical protein
LGVLVREPGNELLSGFDAGTDWLEPWQGDRGNLVVGSAVDGPTR